MLGRGDVLSVESVKNDHEAAGDAARQPVNTKGVPAPRFSNCGITISTTQELARNANFRPHLRLLDQKL